MLCHVMSRTFCSALRRVLGKNARFERLVLSCHIIIIFFSLSFPLSLAPPAARISQPPRFTQIDLHLISTPGPYGFERGFPTVQLGRSLSGGIFWAEHVPVRATLELDGHADGLVPAEALAHVDHAALAVAEAALQLLALQREFILQWWREAFERSVPLDHYAVRVLEACGQGGACRWVVSLARFVRFFVQDTYEVLCRTMASLDFGTWGS